MVDVVGVAAMRSKTIRLLFFGHLASPSVINHPFLARFVVDHFDGELVGVAHEGMQHSGVSF